MAGNPPPLLSPTNTESDTADAGGVIIIHGEISSPVLDFKIVPRHIHVRVDPDPGTTTTASPPLPDPNPGNLVQLYPALSNANSVPDSFVKSRRILNRTPPQIPTQHLRHLTSIAQGVNKRKP